MNEFTKLVTCEKLTLEQVYNTDGFALFWNCTPKRTLYDYLAESKCRTSSKK